MWIFVTLFILNNPKGEVYSCSVKITFKYPQATAGWTTVLLLMDTEVGWNRRSLTAGSGTCQWWSELMLPQTAYLEKLDFPSPWLFDLHYGVHHRSQSGFWEVFISQLLTVPTQNRSKGDSPKLSGHRAFKGKQTNKQKTHSGDLYAGKQASKDTKATIRRLEPRRVIL